MTDKTHATSSSGRSCRRSRTPRSTRTSTRSSSPPTPTRSRSARGRGDLRRAGHQREHAQPQGQAQAQPPHRHAAARARPRSGPSSPSPRATASRSSGADDAGPQAQAHQPRSPVPDRLRLRRDHRRQAREVADQAEAAHRRSQLLRPHDRRATAAAVTSSKYRVVDFRRDKDGVPAKVASIEYDPNRNARIALLHYLDGEKRYIIAPHGARGRRHAPERPGLRDPARQRAAAALHPRRYRRCTTSS